MTILSVLYTLIISPLELLFEVIFSVANRLIGNAGLSIIFLSLAVNFLVLPLYKRADELQNEERDIQAKMAHWIKHIKTTFTGDERFFMLQEYYRINHYKPVYALKSSVSVLLQIPFFIAAYNLLSGMTSLQGMSFGFIPDLGKEDAMFTIGGFPINVLPILMTLINIVSGIIYTKGHPLKEKIQVYGLAAVFLVLLYRSPAGLVFYWLLNNVFSLVKNVFYKLKDPKKVLSIVLAIAGLALIISTLIRSDLDVRQKLLLVIGGFFLSLPLISAFFKKNEKNEISNETKGSSFSFFAGVVLMSLITGFLIPSSVIYASTEEFVNAINPVSPISYLIHSVLISFGCWVLWGSVFYLLASKKTRLSFSRGMWMLCGISIINYLLFGTNLGMLSSVLQYENKPVFSLSDYCLNTFVIILVGFIFRLIHIHFKKISNIILVIGILTILEIGVMNSIFISSMYDKCFTYSPSSSNNSSNDTPSIPLSKNGKNVMVIMLDRAIGPLVPYIFNERPELKDKFDGFTFYPNIISFGAFTNIGSPPLYGGYEYTPARINERSGESLASKQNEALKVMPVLFGENGYKVTIFDPSFAGYKWTPDLSIYDDHPEFRCFNTIGTFNYFDQEEITDPSFDAYGHLDEIRNRNFILFSLMKISPLILQETIYDDGIYNDSSSVSNKSENKNVKTLSVSQRLISSTQSTGYSLEFLESYAVLNKLKDITVVKENSDNYFFIMSNNTTHSPCLLQEPDYIPKLNTDNSSYDVNMEKRYTINGKTLPMKENIQVITYHVNIAAYLKLGEWFDYLRANGVYDNTRIIVVSDHGRELNQFGVYCNDFDMQNFMPVLFVKDFNATGFSISEEFMTNADTPTLAMKDLINHPVNPFTGKQIDMNAKNSPQTVYFCEVWNPTDHNQNTFLPGSWYTVNGNPHDKNSWKYIGDH